MTQTSRPTAHDIAEGYAACDASLVVERFLRPMKAWSQALIRLSIAESLGLPSAVLKGFSDAPELPDVRWLESSFEFMSLDPTGEGLRGRVAFTEVCGDRLRACEEATVKSALITSTVIVTLAAAAWLVAVLGAGWAAVAGHEGLALSLCAAMIVCQCAPVLRSAR